MTHYSAARAREVFSEVLDNAATAPVFIERRGSVAAVVISPAQYETMMEALEEQEDIAEFDAAMSDEGPSIPWDKVKEDLGWV
jgi:antitoxin Phd